ncbi:hypothetical protein N643_08700 [Salmonella bongori serovar 48:z41:-- str. RKS3044]|nr:hypothetical protein N643_08700 [Salmonella bongori serovar 48:z41:-- str. RKS3044]
MLFLAQLMVYSAALTSAIAHFLLKHNEENK